MSAEKPVEVAVVGGGFAGLSLAIGLQKYAHLNVNVYEAAHKFAEVGAGVVLGPNSQRAMPLIDPRILEGYKKRAAYAVDEVDEHGLYPWMTVVKGQAPDIDELVVQYKHHTKGSTIHRAHFLDELVALVEPSRAHFSKRVDHVYETDDLVSPLVLHFGDGTTANADVIIGADGAHSAVRKHVLGPKDPTAQASYTGTIIYRAVVPMEAAKAKLGDIKQETGVHCGKDGMVVGFPMSNQTLYNLAVTKFNNPPWPHDKWIWPADVADVKQHFAEWDDFTRNQVELLPDDGTTLAWSVWDMPAAPTFWKGRVAVMGDAAHATTPFQGAGAGQAIEDALVLSELLGRCLDPARRKSYPATALETVPLILQAYDTTRRFRSQKVVTTSAEAGRVISYNEPGVSAHAKDMAKALEGRQAWIWDHDQEKQVKDALQIFESARAAGEMMLAKRPQGII